MTDAQHQWVVAVASPLGHMPGSAGDLSAITFVFAFDRMAPLWQWRAEPILSKFDGETCG